MIEVFEPSPSGAFLVENGLIAGHVSFTGDVLRMRCNRRWQLLEIHNYFGPIPITLAGNESRRVPKDFWSNYSK